MAWTTKTQPTIVEMVTTKLHKVIK